MIFKSLKMAEFNLSLINSPSSRAAQVLSLKYGEPVTITFALLSIFGTLGIVFSYWRSQNERNTIRQLLLGLSIADLTIAVSNIIGTQRNYTVMGQSSNGTPVANPSLCIVPMPMCVAQSFISSTGYLVTYFYTVTIATYFYIVGVYGVNVEKRLVWIHLFCWLGPLGITITALFLGALGPGVLTSTGPWCWIDACRLSDSERIMWMTINGQGLLIVAYIAVPLLYFFLMRTVNLRGKHQSPFATAQERELIDRPMFRPEDKNFIYTPFILYFLRVWSTIRFIMSAIELYNGRFISSPDTLNKVLFMIQCAGDNAQGFANFILFCMLDASIRRNMLSIFRPRMQDGRHNIVNTNHED